MNKIVYFATKLKLTGSAMQLARVHIYNFCTLPTHQAFSIRNLYNKHIHSTFSRLGDKK